MDVSFLVRGKGCRSGVCGVCVCLFVLWAALDFFSLSRSFVCLFGCMCWFVFLLEGIWIPFSLFAVEVFVFAFYTRLFVCVRLCACVRAYGCLLVRACVYAFPGGRDALHVSAAIPRECQLQVDGLCNCLTRFSPHDINPLINRSQGSFSHDSNSFASYVAVRD